jgi:hypothetical protein
MHELELPPWLQPEARELGPDPRFDAVEPTRLVPWQRLRLVQRAVTLMIERCDERVHRPLRDRIDDQNCLVGPGGRKFAEVRDERRRLDGWNVVRALSRAAVDRDETTRASLDLSGRVRPARRSHSPSHSPR